MIIVKSLIFICGLPAEKTKRKGIYPFSFKSIILQPEEIARESVLGAVGGQKYIHVAGEGGNTIPAG